MQEKEPKKMPDELKNPVVTRITSTGYPPDMYRLEYESPVDGVKDAALIHPPTNGRSDWMVVIHGHGSHETQLCMRQDVRRVQLTAYLQLGKWMEYLKEQGVYDNTRIIIVSDHGRVLGQFDDLIMADDLDVEGYHPILLYKDFGSREFRISDEFMTNADVPSLALQGIEENPVNPFTGNAISEQEKEAGDLLIITSDQFDAGDGAVLDTGGAAWYRFAGTDIFDRESWKKE